MKKLIAVLLLIALVVPIAILPTPTAYALETNTEPFLTVTDSRVYYEDGSIYFATQYLFSKDKTYTYIDNGLKCTLTYADIVPVLFNLYQNNKISFVFNEEEPNKIIRVDKRFRSRTDMDIEFGITGDEVYPPMECEEGVFFSDYISRLDSYLAGGGKKMLELKYLTYAKEIFDIPNASIDFDLIQFNYCYGTDYKSITSNATKIDKNNNMYYHIFENINEETEIILTQTVPNTTIWQVIALVVSVLIILVGVVVVVLKRRKNG